MKDSIRESLSYWGLYARMLRVKKEITPQSVSFGNDRQQGIATSKVIVSGPSAGAHLSAIHAGRTVRPNDEKRYPDAVNPKQA